MFIPKRCPRCQSLADWKQVYNPHAKTIRGYWWIVWRGYNRWNYMYRCEKCGYDNEYSDHAESLDHYRL